MIVKVKINFNYLAEFFSKTEYKMSDALANSVGIVYEQDSYPAIPSILEEVSSELNVKYDTLTTSYKIKEVESATLNKGLTDGITEKMVGLGEGDKVRVIIETDDGYISTPYMKQEDLVDFFDVEGIFDFDSAFPDYSIGSVSGGADVQIAIASAVNGGRGKQINDKSKMYQKKSILRIKNDDNLCLGRCLVCEIASRDNHPKKHYKDNLEIINI